MKIIRDLFQWCRKARSLRLAIEDEVSKIVNLSVPEVMRKITAHRGHSGRPRLMRSVYFVSAESDPEDVQLWIVIEVDTATNMATVAICSKLVSTELMGRYASVQEEFAREFRAHSVNVTISYCDVIPSRLCANTCIYYETGTSMSA